MFLLLLFCFHSFNAAKLSLLSREKALWKKRDVSIANIKTLACFSMTPELAILSSFISPVLCENGIEYVEMNLAEFVKEEIIICSSTIKPFAFHVEHAK